MRQRAHAAACAARARRRTRGSAPRSFTPGAHLDAAAHVDAEGPHRRDRLGDIARVESAGEDQLRAPREHRGRAASPRVRPLPLSGASNSDAAAAPPAPAVAHRAGRAALDRRRQSDASQIRGVGLPDVRLERLEHAMRLAPGPDAASRRPRARRRGSGARAAPRARGATWRGEAAETRNRPRRRPPRPRHRRPPRRSGRRSSRRRRHAAGPASGARTHASWRRSSRRDPAPHQRAADERELVAGARDARASSGVVDPALRDARADAAGRSGASPRKSRPLDARASRDRGS